MGNSKFTYEFYEKLIGKIINNGYEITDYHNYSDQEKPCILRHDVDYDITKAVELATFESSISRNILSTYFFLISSDFYNILSFKNLKALDQILSLGHEIGLHFDETKYEINGDSKQFVEYVEEELFILGKALGTKIRSVSMHRPSKYTLESDIKFPDAVNSYSKEFFINFKYISDSRMNWREDAFSVVECNRFDKLHVLTHPFWYSNKDESTREKLLDFLNNANKDRYENLYGNIRNLNEFVKVEDLC